MVTGPGLPIHTNKSRERGQWPTVVLIPVWILWGLVACWAVINLVGILLNIATMQFVMSVEDGRACGVQLRDLIPQSSLLDFLPGTTKKGLIATVTVFLLNGWTLGIARLMFGVVPNVGRSSHNTGVGIAKLIGVNLAGLAAVVVVTVTVLFLDLLLVSLISSVLRDPGFLDFRLPGACSIG